MARAYQQRYVPGTDREHRLDSAIRLAQFAAATPELHAEHRKRLLKQAAWFATECDGKLTPRYRSREAMAYSGPRYWSVLRHEHVLTLRSLADQMMASPDAVESILRGALACLVTKEEHDRLTAYDLTHEGWDRYRAAHVSVVDAATGQLVIDAAGDGRTLATREASVPASPASSRATARVANGYPDFWRLLIQRVDREHPDWSHGRAQTNYLVL